ncbi:hypothetical protein C5E08_15035 [Rathayibacter iranicus]|uniref:Uncharacterized protein n=1 Tax=Rathayibacter iranicus TaxID=59737 RepID=A0AAD1AGD0_9MICO|nr:hypothetical protein C7V51_15280 [Rathayibacter iranicus]MWV29707.1 hypothetical protein [Rathayibacter iranicus NCPPB 2253 = VKM Ac-1602]PPI41552.1 hypothetical protein C5E09_14140 [Rathayibacter iranicus]PPI57353.1 hypothetical protein C5E08_15035 [Rathayibacter iranicus]PPI68368.1 hypothetical protein C5E01_14090 [Rathayibacter iranicus]
MAELALFLDGEPAGLLRQGVTGNVTFEYDGEYSASAAATPLSLSMPLERRAHPSRAVLPFLEGLLPDSADRRNALAREHGVSARNPFALLSHIGRDAAGAVQILPAGESSPDAARRQGDVELLDDDRFADVVADVIANRDVWGRRELGVRWSLPGAQPKIALFRSRDQLWGVPNDSTPTTHIIKPAVPPYPDHHLNEFMTMAAARHLGLDVANDTMIVTTRGDAAFVSERYDRVTIGARWVRLHQEDLCRSMAVLPQKKYQVDGGRASGRSLACSVVFRRHRTGCVTRSGSTTPSSSPSPRRGLTPTRRTTRSCSKETAQGWRPCMTWAAMHRTPRGARR